MTLVRRTRNFKIHPWVNPDILKDLDIICEKLGYSRDGAIERALRSFIKKYKETQHEQH